jgi:TusA-related sulfurtransferase
MTDDLLDAGRVGCSDLILLIFQRMRALQPEQTLEVRAYDDAAEMDIPAWCRQSGNSLIASDLTTMPQIFMIQKKRA